jgi:hypothetical protein
MITRRTLDSYVDSLPEADGARLKKEIKQIEWLKDVGWEVCDSVFVLQAFERAKIADGSRTDIATILSPFIIKEDLDQLIAPHD